MIALAETHDDVALLIIKPHRNLRDLVERRAQHATHGTWSALTRDFTLNWGNSKLILGHVGTSVSVTLLP